IVDGPATRGALMVGMPLPSTVIRTRRSVFWIAIHASLPSGRHAIASGLVMKRRGAGVVDRLIPWFKLSGAVRRTFGSVCAAVTSTPVAALKTETSPCSFTLKRTGPLGDAPVPTTYAIPLVGRRPIDAS